MATARASEHDHEHKTSLPSREFTGAFASHAFFHLYPMMSDPSSGGPGSLPGPMAEAGVAKLPDERAEHEDGV